MKAYTISDYNAPLKLEEIAKPVAGNGELLVQVRNTSVNYVDLVKASGTAKQIFPIKHPWIPGHEFSGIVEDAGKGDVPFKPGEAVFGVSMQGAYAEYLAVNADSVIRMPKNLSFPEAASVPVSAQTAWEGIFEHGHLVAGQSILIHGGAGAVGAYAVQFAHNIGAHVIVTASTGDKEFLSTMGANQIIDYHTGKFDDEIIGKVDVVLDLVGGDIQQRSYAVLRKGGYLVSAKQPPSQDEASKYQVTAFMMHMTPSSKRLSEIAKLLEEGKVKTDVAAIYPFRDAAQAWKDLEGNSGADKNNPSGKMQVRKHGKLVIQVS
jgi:NADPH:quinone reductase-like Zn-dependent oxidoreductase